MSVTTPSTSPTPSAMTPRAPVSPAPVVKTPIERIENLETSAGIRSPYSDVQVLVGDVKARIEALIVANTNDRVTNEQFRESLEELRVAHNKVVAQFYPQTPPAK